MKRNIPILLLTFSYLIVVSGLSFSIHFCGSKVKYISFCKSVDNEKGCCGNKKRSKGCCHDKSMIIKVETDHILSSDFKLPVNHQIVFNNKLPEINTLLYFLQYNPVVSNYHSPPLINKLPLYITQRILII